MSEIFVAYDEGAELDARRMALSLEMEGWSVSWDMTPFWLGEGGRESIDKVLRNTRFIVILWSGQETLRDRYILGVRMADQNVLLVRLAVSITPHGIKTRSLFDWDGSRSHSDFREIVKVIRCAHQPSTCKAVLNRLRSSIGNGDSIIPRLSDRGSWKYHKCQNTKERSSGWIIRFTRSIFISGLGLGVIYLGHEFVGRHIKKKVDSIEDWIGSLTMGQKAILVFAFLIILGVVGASDDRKEMR